MHMRVQAPPDMCRSINGDEPVFWPPAQVIERAKSMWAEHEEWSKLGERVQFVSGDFFKPGMQDMVPCAVSPNDR